MNSGAGLRRELLVHPGRNLLRGHLGFAVAVARPLARLEHGLVPLHLIKRAPPRQSASPLRRLGSDAGLGVAPWRGLGPRAAATSSQRTTNGDRLSALCPLYVRSLRPLASSMLKRGSCQRGGRSEGGLRAARRRGESHALQTCGPNKGP